MKNEFAPVTPGEMLKEEFLAEYGLSQNQLAKAIGISPNRIADIVSVLCLRPLRGSRRSAQPEGNDRPEIICVSCHRVYRSRNRGAVTSVSTASSFITSTGAVTGGRS